MHIVSNVEGALREGLDAVRGAARVVSRGHVTAPARCAPWKIIDELEPERRGLTPARLVTSASTAT